MSATTQASYGRGARVLSVAIASTGALTAVYFALSSHVLGPVAAKRVDLLWSIAFVVISVLYRPVEQLLSRTVAEHRARGRAAPSLATPLIIQLFFAAVFLAVALALEPVLRGQVFDGSTALYVVLIVAVLAYSASYFARGWLAGHQLFGLYGALTLMESLTRVLFVAVVALGAASGQTAVALGIAAAPAVSLLVVPGALRRLHARHEGGAPPLPAEAAGLRGSANFALAAAGIMLAEQALLNTGVLEVDGIASDPALAGIVFNVLLIVRAPLQLFQSVQTSLLPHLTGLEAREDRAAFGRAVAITVVGIAAFTVLVAAGLLLVGPFVMGHVFGQPYSYGRFGLAAVGLGMGFHLTAGTLNQSALARGRAAAAATVWLACAGLFVAWVALPFVHDVLLRVELGYGGATALLSVLLFALHRLHDPPPRGAP